ARDIFIREALLDPELLLVSEQRPARAAVQGSFLAANRKLRREIERLEAKIRRRDILAGEERQVEFYAARIPEQVSSVSSFEQWRSHAERQNPNVLVMSPADLMLREVTEADEERFPDELEVGGNRLP